MVRVRNLLVLLIVLALGTAFVAAAQAQEGSRRGSGRGFRWGSLLSLLGLEQVQKELKLSEETVAKVTKLSEKIMEDLRKQNSALREIEDREKQRAKFAELRDQADRKTREGLRDVLASEQMRRLYQIRNQVRAVVESLASRYVSGKLELTDEQKEKLAAINKDKQAKTTELVGALRDASQEQRTEMYPKFRKIRTDADEKALALLTAAQKKAFEEMKGEKIVLQFRRGRR